MRFKFLIAYDGAPFAGWQSQTCGNTIQDYLEAAAAKITKTRIVFHGSGRTDAGVHALGQCAHADLPPLRMIPAQWIRAFNANLPPEIRVLRISPVSDCFHARFSAIGKVYRYTLWIGPILPPMEFHRVWHLLHPPDLDRLRTALGDFIGTHDFASFAANRATSIPDTTRAIHSIRVAQRAHRLSITFEGSGFLYKMVRMLTAAAVRVAKNREAPHWISSLLASAGRIRCTYVAPADGLTLVRVHYR